MYSTAHHPANNPTVGRRGTRHGAVVAGIALAVAGAVSLTGALFTGDDDVTRLAAGIERPSDVISRRAATDTMITRTLGDRTGNGSSLSGEPAATDTMITRTLGDRTVTGGSRSGEPAATDTMITRGRGG